MNLRLGMLLKKVIFSFCIIYGTNIAIKSTGICLPINIATLMTTCVLGIPGLISLFVIFFIIN